MLYLSDYKKHPKVKVDVQGAGLTAIDTFNVDFSITPAYRTVKYKFTAEDATTKSPYSCSFTVSHDSLMVRMSEFEILYGPAYLDLDIDANYIDVVNGYPTKIEVTVDFPVGFNGSWTLDKEVFINTTQIQKDGSDAPSLGIYPSNYLYPNG